MARPLKPLVHSGGWYPSKKWIPLVRNGGYTTQNGGEPPVNWSKVSGVPPLSLPNAAAYFINSLKQVGKCTVSGTDITCNNGKLVAVDDELPSGYERQIGFVFAASTYYLISGFYLRGSDTVRFSFSADKACNVFGCYTTNSATDNYSLYASTSSGGKYLRYDGSTYNSYIPSAQIGERLDVVITPTGTTGMPTDSVIAPAEFEATADLCIGTTSTSASSSKLDGNMWGNFVVDGRLTLIPCKRLSDDSLGYYDLDSDTFYEPIGSAPTSLGVDSSHLTALSVDGTPEVLIVGEQTASVENLLAVDDIKDEHNIISGAVTRRCEAVVSDGTTPSGRYIGEVGEGNIIVKVRETGYEGDVATFEADRAEPLNGLTVNVEPIQDLHGYDSPWPAGGGKNRIPYPYYSQDGTLSGVTFSTAQDGKITASGTTTEGVNFFLARDISLAAGTYTLSIDGTHTALTLLARNPAAGITLATIAPSQATATFTLAETTNVRLYFNTNAVGAAVSISAYVQLEAGSTATAYAPYSNICPISGRTSATVTRTGRNLLDDSDMQILTTQLRIARDEGLGGNPFLLKGGCTYTLSCNSSEPASAIYLIKPYTSVSQAIAFRFNSRSITYAPEEDIEVGCVLDWSNGRPEDATHLMLELGSTATAYDPYAGNTYTIALGETVYGGTLDVTQGKMSVTHILFSRNSATMNNTENYPGWNDAGLRSYGFPSQTVKNVIGSVGNVCGTNTGGLSNDILYLPLSSYNKTQAEWIALAVDIQFVLPLPTPFEITLTPTQIDTLIGQNNVWSDAGAVKAYVADGDVIEHVTAQPLRTVEGTNTVSVTSNVDPVELSVEYAIAVGE